METEALFLLLKILLVFDFVFNNMLLLLKVYSSAKQTKQKLGPPIFGALFVTFIHFIFILFNYIPFIINVKLHEKCIILKTTKSPILCN